MSDYFQHGTTSSIQPVPRTSRFLSVPPISRYPPDSIIYGGFGKNWTLQEYRQYIERQGYQWTSELHHQVLVKEQFIRNNIGYGYTIDQIKARHEASGVGRECSPAFLGAFKQCELDYFYAEISGLIARKYSLPKLLDMLKGGNTRNGIFVKNEKLADGRRAIRRLFAGDATNHKLRHGIKGMPSQEICESEKALTNPFARGFLQDLDGTAVHGNSHWRKLNAVYAPEGLSSISHIQLDPSPRLGDPSADLTLLQSTMDTTSRRLDLGLAGYRPDLTANSKQGQLPNANTVMRETVASGSNSPYQYRNIGVGDDYRNDCYIPSYAATECFSQFVSLDTNAINVQPSEMAATQPIALYHFPEKHRNCQASEVAASQVTDLEDNFSGSGLLEASEDPLWPGTINETFSYETTTAFVDNMSGPLSQLSPTSAEQWARGFFHE